MVGVSGRRGSADWCNPGVTVALEQLAGNAQRHSDAWKPSAIVDLHNSLEATAASENKRGRDD
jgi:hypothetical protein